MSTAARLAQESGRFALEWREDERALEEGLVANSPESVAYNVCIGLTEGGKPIDPRWRP